MHLGIDFGTWYTSAVLRLNDGTLLAVKDPHNQSASILSTVYLSDNGQCIIGEAADELGRDDPSRQAREIKLALGRGFPLQLGDRAVAPEDLVAEILSWVKRQADRMVKSWGQPPLTAVTLTVPALYRDFLCELMVKAAVAAGFRREEVSLLPEPVAAALDYARQQDLAEGAVFLVYDLGGGTFDTAVLRKEPEGYRLLGVPDGLNDCGGVHFDRLIYGWLSEQASPQLQTLLDRHKSPGADAQRFRSAVLEKCRRLKQLLSGMEQADLSVEVPGTAGPERYRLTQDVFAQLLDPHLERTIECCQNAVARADLRLRDVDRVLLVGGSCRIPAVAARVRQALRQEVVMAPELELAICWGAALYQAAVATRPLIVGPGGYSSIGEAIRVAPAGTEIHVKPGVYRESLVLNKSITIIGDGLPEEVVLESAEGPCLAMQTDWGLVRGLTIRCLAGASSRQVYSVDVAQGQLILEDCDITSDSLSCVAIYGEAQPVLSNCRIHHGRQAGVFVYEKGAGRLLGCSIYANKLSGVEVCGSGTPLLTDCTIYDNQTNGICVRENGAGRLVRCEIYHNRARGVDVYGEGNPVLEECHIHEMEDSGVWIHDAGKGTFRDCQIWGNGTNGASLKEGDKEIGTLRDGVSVGTGGAPEFVNCQIRDSVGAGVWVYDGGRGSFRDCDISGNQSENVQISGGASPFLSNCYIHGGKTHGIDLHAQAGGIIENCKVYDNAGMEVRISARASTTILGGNGIAFYPPGGYDRLRPLLQKKTWAEADQETMRLIRATSGYSCIDNEAKATALSSDFLRVLDYLWESAGGGKLKDRPFVSDPSLGLTGGEPSSFGFVDYVFRDIKTWLKGRLDQLSLL
jgi:Ethanolamine utilization protein EutJ (predicted chaperonin)